MCGVHNLLNKTSKDQAREKEKKGRSCLLTYLLAYFFFLSVVVEVAYAKRFFAQRKLRSAQEGRGKDG
jgi:hypothetical protein